MEVETNGQVNGLDNGDSGLLGLLGEEGDEESQSSSNNNSNGHQNGNSSPSNGIKKEAGSDSDDEDDMPLSVRMKDIKQEKESPASDRRRSAAGSGSARKREAESSDEDDVPLSERMKKVKKEEVAPKRKKRTSSSEDEYKPEVRQKSKKRASSSEDEYKPDVRRKSKDKRDKKDKRRDSGRDIKKSPKTPSTPQSPKKRVKKEEEEPVWKWWEEEQRDDGVKWKTLEHNGVLFAPDYDPLPKSVKFYYDGNHVKLSEAAEEVGGFYARMLDNDYTTKEAFNTNFFKDWRKVMTGEERALITDLKKCDFRQIHKFYQEQSEERKNRSKEEKLKLKEQKDEEQKKYGFAYMDGYKQKIGNFRIEPPGLFRGRGDHPKMGKLKKRIRPEDIIINCSKGAQVPPPPEGHKWKEVRHDNTVTWLASWTENIAGNIKYIMLNPSSKIKGQKDWQKYETARRLKQHVGKIRLRYGEDMKSKEMRIRQRATAVYLIDKLALRAGNEKDEDSADTVGCCSLRVEHITLREEKDGDTDKYMVDFDFLGKDSIQYLNTVAVEKRVYKNLKIFTENKKPEDDLFDRVDTTTVNKYLQELMPDLTAKVFRTYNASFTLQQQLNAGMKNADKMTVHEKVLAYNRANREVAILCNHQRAVPKTHGESMSKLEAKIKDKKAEVKEAKAEAKSCRGAAGEKAKKKYLRLKEQLKRMEIQRTDKDENKTIALGTSKLNYLDPRISVAWCKKFDVPIEKVYSKTQREKFQWAIDMATEDYEF